MGGGGWTPTHIGQPASQPEHQTTTGDTQGESFTIITNPSIRKCTHAYGRRQPRRPRPSPRPCPHVCVSVGRADRRLSSRSAAAAAAAARMADPCTCSFEEWIDRPIDRPPSSSLDLDASLAHPLAHPRRGQRARGHRGHQRLPAEEDARRALAEALVRDERLLPHLLQGLSAAARWSGRSVVLLLH